MTKRDLDRQCSSCGGFCKKSGCERENVLPPIDWKAKHDAIRAKQAEQWSLIETAHYTLSKLTQYTKIGEAEIALARRTEEDLRKYLESVK